MLWIHQGWWEERGWSAKGKDCANIHWALCSAPHVQCLCDSSQPPTSGSRGYCWRNRSSQRWSNVPTRLVVYCKIPPVKLQKREFLLRSWSGQRCSCWKERLEMNASPNILPGVPLWLLFPLPGLSYSPTPQFLDLTHHLTWLDTIHIFLP